MDVRRKLKGSTLFEVLIATIISAIVVAIALSVWKVVYRQISLFQSNYHQITEIQKLEQRLQFDFDKALSTQWNDTNELLFIIQSNDTISYEFREGALSREDQIISADFSKVTSYLEGKEKTSGLIDAVRIDFVSDKKEVTLFISRMLTTEDKMKN